MHVTVLQKMEVGKMKYLSLLFLLSLLGYTPTVKSAPVIFDSVGIQTVNGKQFLVHQVKAKETHFVLARKYKVPVNQIFAANPHYKNGLKAGELVYIPRKSAAKPINKATAKFKTDTQGNVIHVVSGKQTLFSIARQYSVKATDIKKWNNLTADGVKIGQKLVIGLPAKPKVASAAIAQPRQLEEKPESKPTVSARSATQVPAPLAIVSSEAKTTPISQLPTPATRVTQVAESGVAEIINADVNKFLALHHAAPVGTYITVRNPMNGRSISARVIGQLPDTGANEKIIVKLSKKAQRRLAAIDNRFRVDVSYSQVEDVN